MRSFVALTAKRHTLVTTFRPKRMPSQVKMISTIDDILQVVRDMAQQKNKGEQRILSPIRKEDDLMSF